jgi:hypothetical protein
VTGRLSGRSLAWEDARLEKADVAFEPAPGSEEATSIHVAISGGRKGELPLPDATADATLGGGALNVAARALEG